MTVPDGPRSLWQWMGGSVTPPMTLKRPKVLYPFTEEVRTSLFNAVCRRLTLHVEEAKAAVLASRAFNRENDPDGSIRARLLTHRRKLAVYTRTLLCLRAWLCGRAYREVEPNVRVRSRLAWRMGLVLVPLLLSRGVITAVSDVYNVIAAWLRPPRPGTEAPSPPTHEKDTAP